MKKRVNVIYNKLSIDEICKPVIVCLAMTLISSMLMNVLVILTLTTLTESNDILVSLVSDISIFISLVVVPYLFYKKYMDKGYRIHKRIVITLTMSIISSLILSQFFPVLSVIHFFVIAMSEEIQFREFQYKYLQSDKGVLFSIIVSSIIFSFILHLNENIIGNLLIRFPLGIVLCYVRHKFGLSKSVYLHWVYNLFVIHIL